MGDPSERFQAIAREHFPDLVTTCRTLGEAHDAAYAAHRAAQAAERAAFAAYHEANKRLSAEVEAWRKVNELPPGADASELVPALFSTVNPDVAHFLSRCHYRVRMRKPYQGRPLAEVVRYEWTRTADGMAWMRADAREIWLTGVPRDKRKAVISPERLAELLR